MRPSIITLLGLFLSLVASRPASAQSAPTAWELSPYRIKLIAAADPGSESLEETLTADLLARSAAVVGGAWRIEVLPPTSELRKKFVSSLSAVTAEDLPAAALDADKVLLIGVRPAGGGYRVEAREFDTLTQLWNVTVAAEAAQPRELGPRAFQALLRSFAPLARIESTEGQTATLRLRASAIARRDRNLPAVLPGSAFRPVLVKSDTKGALEAGSGEVLAGVYLSPTGASGGLLTCRIDAGTGSQAIPEYHPHRQRLALAISPGAFSTQLKLVGRGEAAAPLEGYDVLDGPDLLGRTDRRGLVTVPPGKDTLRMLTIRRGEATLAHLPIVPGLTPEVTLPVAGDDGSLALEAQIAALEDALIDLVARRQVLAARIRAAAKSGDQAGGQALLSQLRSITPADTLATQLGQADQSLASASTEAQARLRTKLDSLQQLLDKFRAESPADQLETELKNAPPAP